MVAWIRNAFRTSHVEPEFLEDFFAFSLEKFLGNVGFDRQWAHIDVGIPLGDRLAVFPIRQAPLQGFSGIVEIRAHMDPSDDRQ